MVTLDVKRKYKVVLLLHTAVSNIRFFLQSNISVNDLLDYAAGPAADELS